MEEFSGFFTQLFNDLTVKDSWLVLLFMFIPFLLGLIFGRGSYRRKFKRLRKEHEQKVKDYNLLKVEYDTLQQQQQQLELDLKNANQEVEEVTAKLERSMEEKSQMRTQLYNASERIQELETANASYVTDVEVLNDQVLTLRTQNEHLSTATTSIEANNTSIPSSSNLAGLEEDYSDTKSRIETIEERLDQLVQENNRLKYEISEIQTNAPVATHQDTAAGFVDDIPNPGVNTLDEVFFDEETDEGNVEAIRDQNIVSDPPSVAFEPGRSDKAKIAIREALGTRIKAATASEKDDLKLINGIGPFIEEKLNDIGIYTFEQVIQFDKTMIELVTDAIQFFPGRIERDDWVGQANKLLS